MTPKEKALELVYKYLDKNNNIEDWKIEIGIDWDLAKQCALITVDEIINYLLDSDWVLINNKAKYWEEVKQEINLL